MSILFVVVVAVWKNMFSIIIMGFLSVSVNHFLTKKKLHITYIPLPASFLTGFQKNISNNHRRKKKISAFLLYLNMNTLTHTHTHSRREIGHHIQTIYYNEHYIMWCKPFIQKIIKKKSLWIYFFYKMVVNMHN